MKQNKPNFDEVIERLTAARVLVGRVQGFCIPDGIKQNFDFMLNRFEEGDATEAINTGLDVETGLYRVLAAFFRNSPDGYFAPRLAALDDLGMTQDIMDRVRKVNREFNEALLAEQGTESFERRIAAYNALREVIDWAPTEHKRREKNRMERAKVEAEKVAAARAEADRQRAAAMREQELVRRREKVAGLRSMFST